MKKTQFDELLASVEEMDAIRNGKATASREFTSKASDSMVIQETALRQAIAQGLSELDQGQGRPLDRESLKAEARQRRKPR